MVCTQGGLVYYLYDVIKLTLRSQFNSRSQFNWGELREPHTSEWNWGFSYIIIYYFLAYVVLYILNAVI